MVLAKPCPSLTTILKFYMVVRWPVVVWWPCMDEGDLRCSLYPYPNILADSPMQSSSQSVLLHLNQYITPWFDCMGYLSLGDACIFLSILLLLEIIIVIIINMK